ncbi:TPA: fimbrial protein [Klebsiella oxytoca]|uniref:Fimbrial protein n=1 Tax=Klebsiella oxytoca TaxID=571 RepID=A0AAN5RHC2_KLEOX|nr:fimbrial protein [Klebsiella oxytoca]
MFKKSVLAVTVVAAMMSAAPVWAADPAPSTGPFGSGTIHFTGTITNSPCSIAPGDEALTVSFGQVSRKVLKNEGDFSPSQPIVIHLTGCSFDPDTPPTGGTANPVGAMSRVQVSFGNTAVITGSHAFANTAGGADAAQNVGVQLLESNNSTIIEPNTASAAQQLQAGDNQLKFFARLLAVGGAATPGNFDASVNYTLTYL